MLIVLTQIILSIILFFGINLLGHHAPSSLGYYQLTTFLETEEAPAFNFVLRVLTPTVYIILISAFFYGINLDSFTTNIYLISVYYVTFRTIFNIAVNRAILINWVKFTFRSLCIIGLSYFVYQKFIITKTNLLPDFSNMANELWVIMIIFLYNFINNITPSDKNAQKRKDKYVEIQFASIDRKYTPIIQEETNNERLRQIALAIIIYEDFNRPKLFRLIEYLNHFLSRKPHTLGMMQVRSTKFIGDTESVRLGMRKILNDFAELQKDYSSDEEFTESGEYKDETYQRRLIEKFNPDSTYSYEVIELADEINTKYFKKGSKKLFEGT